MKKATMVYKAFILTGILMGSSFVLGCSNQAEPQQESNEKNVESIQDSSSDNHNDDNAANTTTDDANQASISKDEEAAKDNAGNHSDDKTKLAADAGKNRYTTTCRICHDQGLLDAPKISDKAEWQKRAAKGKEVLYMHSAKGFNKMPAQATGEVSEAEVHAAVDYILSQTSS